MADFFEGWYDETPLANQVWQGKYNMHKEYIQLLTTRNITFEQRKRLDILHHGTEDQIKQLAENK